MTNITFRNLGREWDLAHDESVEAVRRVLASSVFVLGAEVSSFETEFAGFCTTRYSVGVGSGLAALELALRSLEIGRGDEVIVPAYTFVATWLAVAAVGATPIGADVDLGTGNLDPDAAAAAISPRTAAIVPVHLFGIPAPMDELGSLAVKHGLAVVEDAAQAHGARIRGRSVGTLGDAAAFSFYPTKNLGAAGDAGAVTTDRADVAQRVRQYRSYGATEPGVFDSYGTNSRLDEVQAAILRVRLSHLPELTERRRRIADRYSAGLGDLLSVPAVPNGHSPVWHIYNVRVPCRDRLSAHLATRGIETASYYRLLPADQAVLRHVPRTSTPSADELSRTALALPCHPAMEQAVDRIVDEIGAFFRGTP